MLISRVHIFHALLRILINAFFPFRCYLKLGQWQESLQGINENSIQTVLHYYNAATDHDNKWYKAWHSWAYMNFETVLFYKQFNASQSFAESTKTTNVSTVFRL